MLKKMVTCVLVIVLISAVIPSNADANPRAQRLFTWLGLTYLGSKVGGVFEAVEDAAVDLYESAEDAIIDWYVEPYTSSNQGYCHECSSTYYETHSCIYLDSYASESHGGPTYYDNYDNYNRK